MKLPRLAIAVLAAVTAAANAQTDHSAFPKELQLLDKFCVGCHNADDYYGGLAFEMVSTDNLPKSADVWEKALRKLRGHLMPPPGSEQPTQQEIDKFSNYLTTSLDKGMTHPGAGHVPLQRLDRTEFGLAVKDLLGVEINAADFLPGEIEVDGFENMAAALSMSPAFMDQYIGAVRAVAHKAVGEPAPKMANVTYLINNLTDQSSLPPGSRGGVKFRHNFPADGEYRFTVLDLNIGLYPSGVESRQTLIALVDNREIFRGDIGGEEDLALANRTGAAGNAKILSRFANIPVTLKAGMHDVIFAFVERSHAESDVNVGGRGGFGGGGGGRVARMQDGIQIVGPFNSTGVSMTPSRAKIFVCQPASASDEAACASKIISNLATKAFRRNVTDADVAAYLPFYQAGRKGPGGFDEGIEQVVAAVLASPDFLYRGISPSKDIGSATVFALNQTELATRMSFFMWGQGPDDTLLRVAQSGKLTDTAEMNKQIKRMLADKRANYLVDNFALRWLNIDDLTPIKPEPAQFPGFNNALRDDFSSEATLFIKSILLENRPVGELLTASHTFLNDRLARHYGINDVFGSQFRRVELKDPNRFGLLGKSAVLLRTSYGDRTSPVLRGAWVLEKLMGTPPTPPPPNVNTDLAVPSGEKITTVRQRLEKHRDNPTCKQCHGVIDPIGLSLENFSVTGQWREIDPLAQAKIDASSVLPSGVPVHGPLDLRNELTKKPEQFAEAFTERLLMYSINRQLQYFDMPQVRAIVRSAEKQHYTLNALIEGIVQSPAFRLQAVPESDKRVGLANPPVHAQ